MRADRGRTRLDGMRLVALPSTPRLERAIAVAPSAGLLVLRLVVGMTFLLHGLDKLGDASGTEQFFASLSIPAPGVTGPVVALTETTGGLLLLAGLATPLAGIALAGDMLVAFATAHLGNGFFVENGGGELVLLLAGASLALVLTGAGSFSLDAALGVSHYRSRPTR
jgi:putative oxidoreductase